MALQKFPGFIDVHVHLREPGATQKEDFTSGTRAAVKGGFTFILDMPNNPGRPTISLDRLEEKVQLSTQKSVCDVGFHYGTDGKNIDSFPKAWSNPHVFGLKIYCNHTTGELLIDNASMVFASWNSQKPILVHAVGGKLTQCIQLAKQYSRRLHVCHVSNVSDVEKVRVAKNNKLHISAGVTPHHLFLKKAVVKPSIDTASQDALWEALCDGTIDFVESDHAPHTKEEKKLGAFGVPGLETTVGLLLKKDKKSPLVRWLYENPKKIFRIPDQQNTYIELDPQKPYVVGADDYETKCGWSPFEGWELYGKVQSVILGGRRLL